MYFFYNLVIRGLTLLFSPLLVLLLLVVVKFRKKIWARLGFLSRTTRELLQEMPRPRVWLHAASVGEIAAMAPIARILKERDPRLSLVVSTMTLSGLAQAEEKIPFAVVKFLVPLDFPRNIRRLVRLVEPNLLVIAETEIWPNLIREAKQSGSQVALVNGRMSEKSLHGYRWFRGLFCQVMSFFDLMAIQSAEDEARFLELGANPQRMKLIGNVKFDAGSNRDLTQLRRELHIPEEGFVWVAGSTRPGEEEIIIEAFKQVLEQVPQAVLILAVRHLERLRDVERLLADQRLPFTRRTQANQELLNFPVILIDTMGELADIYGMAQVAFVGGSLAPFGGHNPLEPAGKGVPVLMGPHTGHFAQIVEVLKERGALTMVQDAKELAQNVVRYYRDPECAKRQGVAGSETVKNYQGSALKTVELLQKLMLIKQWAGEVKGWRAESIQKNNFAQSKESMPDNWPGW